MSVKLLVVEDHPVFRDGLLLALQRMAAKPLVYTASSVSECEEFVLHVSDIDLAIIDLKLLICIQY